MYNINYFVWYLLPFFFIEKNLVSLLLSNDFDREGDQNIYLKKI